MKIKNSRFAALVAASALLFGGLVAAPASAAVDACTAGQACAGDLTRNLGKYDIKIPASGFNGTVLVYFHGYKFSSSAPLPAAIGAAGGYATNPTYASIPGVGFAGNGVAEVAPDNSVALIAALQAEGFALAGIGYGARQGWASQEALAAGQELIKNIKSGQVPGVKKVIVWGHSLGGFNAAVQAEKNSLVDGALPMCSAYTNIDGALALAQDALWVFKSVAGLPLKMTYSWGTKGYMEAAQDLNMALGLLLTVSADATSGKDATTTEQYWAAVTKAPVAAFPGVKGVPVRNVALLAGLIAGIPEASKTYDGLTTAGAMSAAQLNSTAAITENLADAIALGVLAKYEAEMRIRLQTGLTTESVNFVDNTKVDYSARMDEDIQAQYEIFLNLTGGFAKKADGTADLTAPLSNNELYDTLVAAVNTQTGRMTANRSAVAAVKKWPQLTGAVRVPTISMHPEFDNVTPAGNQLLLKAKYDAYLAKLPKAKKAAATKAGNLVLLYQDAPDEGWTTFGATGFDATATAAKRLSGIGHCSGASNPQIAAGQMIGALKALNAWVTTGAKGKAAVTALKNNPALYFQTDQFWEPAVLQREKK